MASMGTDQGHKDTLKVFRILFFHLFETISKKLKNNTNFSQHFEKNLEFDTILIFATGFNEQAHNSNSKTNY